MKGTITKRSKNSWRIRVDLGRDPETGKRKQLSREIKGIKSDAERELRRVFSDLDNGYFVRPRKLTMADYFEQWLQGYAATNVRARTLERYQGIIRNHLIPSLGKIQLTQLQPSHIQACYAKSLSGRLDGKPGTITAKTVLQHHRVLKQALSHAVKWGLMSRNPAKATDPPKPVNKEMRALSYTEVSKLLEAAQGTEYHTVVHLAVFTGLRRSELLGLRWQDINLTKRSLSIVRTLQQLKGSKFVFLEPKTRGSRRTIELTPMSALVLRSHREQQEAIKAEFGIQLAESDLVFSKPDGSPLKPDTITRSFLRIARSVGLQGVRFHDLRHTHATIMLQQDVHPKIVQDRLGHSTIAITIDTYSHVLPGIQEAAALRFDEAFIQAQTATECGQNVAS